MKSHDKKKSPETTAVKKRRVPSTPSGSGQKEEKDKKKGMNPFLKYGLFVLAGVAVALLFLGLYSWFIDPYDGYGEPEELPPVNVSGKAVFITGISGEVYIIRNDRIITADIGDSLKEGDVLKVVDQSYCQIQFSDRGTAGLDSNTVMLMKKLVNAQKEMQIKTEVLMGSMLYRVKKLSESDQFEVESDGVLYEVKGTEFLVMRSKDGVLLAVEEGTVHYTVDGEERTEPLVETGEQVFIAQDDRSRTPVYPMGESASLRIDNLKRMNQISVEQGAWPVTVVLESSPAGADIYIEGRKIATGYFSGLFDVGSELNVLVRKRGYLDRTLHLAIKAGEDRIYLIKLEPSGLEETISEEEKSAESFEAILNRMRQQHEAEIEAQKNQFTAEINRKNASIRDLNNERESLLEDKEELETALDDRTNQITELRKLMTQIQELSNQQD